MNLQHSSNIMKLQNYLHSKYSAAFVNFLYSSSANLSKFKESLWLSVKFTPELYDRLYLNFPNIQWTDVLRITEDNVIELKEGYSWQCLDIEDWDSLISTLFTKDNIPSGLVGRLVFFLNIDSYLMKSVFNVKFPNWFTKTHKKLFYTYILFID